MSRGTERVILWAAILILAWMAWHIAHDPGQWLLLRSLGLHR